MDSSKENKTFTKPSKTVSAIAGGISGALTRFFCQPLDVVKIRFQLQVEPISKNYVESKYNGIGQAVKLIIKEEGISALWKGHVPGQMLSIVYGIVQFGIFELLREEAHRFMPGVKQESMINFVSGSVAGCYATILSFPFDVVRTRLVAQGSDKPLYHNMRTALKYIYLNEGAHALWKGLSPTLIQAAPLAGTQFAFYKFFRKLFVQLPWLGEKNEGEGNLFIGGSLLAGSLAGLTSKTITYPFDLARKRMQIQGFQDARKGFGKQFVCTGLISCIVTTIRGENVFALFKGLSPSLVKAVFANALIFSVYEKSVNILMQFPGIF